ncbi:MAG TPA: hypothetical protein VG841_02975 [Caulobacterales bacterium]|nr:hypothetical protein [Caulobacterales bacterium]
MSASPDPIVNPDFARMSEADVREEIIRPFLHRLGYRHGASANIRTDYSLRYSKVQLGRKNPRDPDLPGPRKPDYICEVISYGRFVVETKAGDEALTDESASQAYSYAAHPEIAAFYFLLANGREFRLYEYGNPTKPVLQWSFEETDDHWVAIQNLIGPAAIQRRAGILRPDPAKPLALGLDSTAEIVGGSLLYHESSSGNPTLVEPDLMAGMQASVLGRSVYRNSDQLITAELELAGPYSTWTEINKAVGWETFKFSCADEFLSVDRDRPSILQNVAEATLPPGLRMRPLPNMDEIQVPLEMELKVFTQAVGYLDGRRFVGAFDTIYELTIKWPNPFVAKMAAQQFPGIDGVIPISNGGEFEVRIR